MIRKLAICLAIASLTLAAPRPAAAVGVITHRFNTVDAVELQYMGGSVGYILVVTGILTNGGAPTTHAFQFDGTATGQQQSERCERQALLALSRPGKFQLGIGTPAGIPFPSGTVCKLTRIAP